MPSLPDRATVFITHAAPEDNEFALWLSSKLAMAGYRVWIDRRRLRGGDDFWDEIDGVLRNEAIKQVVVFTTHIGKLGVKKELAIGGIVAGRLKDPKFLIPVRADSISFSDAPPEFLRGNILNAHPNWHDCLKDLFETLEEARIPKAVSPDAAVLHSIVEAREDGRRFILQRPEQAISNWFPITPPPRVRYYQFTGLQEQVHTWLEGCTIPHVGMLRLAGSFADPVSFAKASTFEQQADTAYDIPFVDFISGVDSGPFVAKADASRDVVNLLRQHFDEVARARGLLPVEFANKQVGWFFPDNLLPANRLSFELSDGRRIRRVMSGKFKALRWHVCLLAKPRIWPDLVYRIHVNVVLSEDGKTPIAGDKTHKRRRRLTKSWWNDVWRDRLLAAVRFLANGNPTIAFKAGNEIFEMAIFPLVASLPVSYEASDAPMTVEEDENGNIIPRAELDGLADEPDDSEFEDDDRDEDEDTNP